jgi:hypothetical protein
LLVVEQRQQARAHVLQHMVRLGPIDQVPQLPRITLQVIEFIQIRRVPDVFEPAIAQHALHVQTELGAVVSREHLGRPVSRRLAA